ncbi:MAG: hypothetical protein IPP66_20155 [Anaerolineales bacterium]|nr:hypothetical protein [Anaerolineales bacterium]
MKKVLLTLLAVIVILGALGAAGFAGYRIGYMQGASTSGKLPATGFYHMNPSQMPMHRFNDDFGGWNQQYRPPMMGRGGFGMGMGFFSPFHFIWNIAVLGLVIWFVYWLFTKSGWRITRTTTNTQTSDVKTEGN